MQSTGQVQCDTAYFKFYVREIYHFQQEKSKKIIVLRQACIFCTKLCNFDFSGQ